MFAVLLAPMTLTPPLWLVALCLASLCLCSDRVMDGIKKHKALAGVIALGATLAGYVLTYLVCYYCDWVVLGWWWGF
jgi:hypothetical protein